MKSPSLILISLPFFLFVICEAKDNLLAPKTAVGSQLPKKLRISTFLNSPYIQKDGEHYSGYLMDILREIIQNLNMSFMFVDDNKERSAVIEDIVSDKAHLGLVAMEMTPKLLNEVEYSVPVMRNGIVAMRRRQLPNLVERSVFFCLSPFSASVWVSLVFVLLLTTGLVTLNAARNPRERSQRLARGELGLEAQGSGEEAMTLREHLFQGAWYVLSTAALQSAPRQPMSVTGRLLSLTWWLFAGLILCAYLAALLMGMVMPRGLTAPSFSSVTELAMQTGPEKYRVFFVPPSIGEDVFQNHADKNFQHLYALSLKSDSYLQNNVNRGDRDSTAWANALLQASDRNIVIISSESARALFKHLDCGKMVATEFVDDRYLSLVFPRNATALRVAVNKVLLKIHDNGAMRAYIRKWKLEDSGQCNLGPQDMGDYSWSRQQADQSESTIAAAQALATLFHDSIPIGFTTFAGILLLYIFGLLFTGVGLAADLYIYSRIERHKRGNQVLTNRGGQHRISDTPDFENFNEL